jgi:hypothetical protein
MLKMIKLLPTFTVPEEMKNEFYTNLGATTQRLLRIKDNTIFL